jgi:hypothetical protein
MESAATEVSGAGEIKQPGRHIQNSFEKAAGEVRPDFKKRHTISGLKGNRCQRTNIKLSFIFYLPFSK